MFEWNEIEKNTFFLKRDKKEFMKDKKKDEQFVWVKTFRKMCEKGWERVWKKNEQP